MSVCKYQFSVIAAGQGVCILSYQTKSPDQFCTSILLQCLSVFLQIKGRSQRMIRMAFFSSFYSEFGPIIDGGNTRQRIEQDVHRSKMGFLHQFCIDAFHIVIVYKIIQLEPIRSVTAHTIESLHRMGNFEIIVIVVSGIECFMQVIVRNRMECSLIDPADIIPMNHFSHQPKIGLHFVGRTSHRFHIGKIQHICSVQPYPVNIKFADPETDDITDIVPDRRVVLIQFYQKIVSAPILIGKSIVVFVISPEIHMAVPVPIGRIFSVLFDILKCKEISARMIENTVQYDTNALTVTLLHEGRQIFVGAKSAVQFFIICCFIAMAHRFKQWTDIESITANLSDMGNPWKKGLQPML